ncbi:MAG: hypothetical protein JXR48_02105 [Candidatus Delongbacteria bacterium]|nr:hypothetical protein [Candidatus Delongbacteria bacterium]MBN2833739.1 hypothetical protein [Candidatus Delongbacteria bacterium]
MPITDGELKKICLLNEPFTTEFIKMTLPNATDEEIEANLNFNFPFYQGKYYPNSYFMKNFTIRIEPTELEIKNGIVIPGNRMIGLIDNLAIYDNFIFKYDDKILKSKKMKGNIEDMLIYIALLEIVKSPVADSTQSTITLNGIDLKKFYKDNNFTYGDSILVSCIDFEKSLFKITYESKLDRNSNYFITQEQDNLFLSKLRKIIKEKNIYTNSTCQILAAYLEYSEDKKTELAIPLTTIFKLVFSEKSKVKVRPLEMGRVALCNEDDNENDSDFFPLGKAMSEFEYSNSNTDLKKIKNLESFFDYFAISLTEIEVRALLFDQLSDNEIDIDDICEVIFRGKEDPTSDVLNLLSSLLKKELEKVKKYDVKVYKSLPVAQFRKKLLTYTFKIINILRSFDQNGFELHELPMREMSELAVMQQIVLSNLELLEKGKFKDLTKMINECNKTFLYIDLLDSMIQDFIEDYEIDVDDEDFEDDDDEGEEYDDYDYEDFEIIRRESNTVFQFKVAVCDWDLKFNKNPYRIFEMSADATLGELADSILDLFEFDCDHLYGFYDFIKNRRNSRERYELEPYDRETLSVKSVFLNDVFRVGKKMLFLYDYGDQWKFMVKLEKSRAMIDDDSDLFEDYGDYNLLKSVGESPEQYRNYEEEEDNDE